MSDSGNATAGGAGTGISWADFYGPNAAYVLDLYELFLQDASRVDPQTREFFQQAWFIASVTIVPTALVAIPFGAVIALQVGGQEKAVSAPECDVAEPLGLDGEAPQIRRTGQGRPVMRNGDT